MYYEILKDFQLVIFLITTVCFSTFSVYIKYGSILSDLIVRTNQLTKQVLNFCKEIVDLVDKIKLMDLIKKSVNSQIETLNNKKDTVCQQIREIEQLIIKLEVNKVNINSTKSKEEDLLNLTENKQAVEDLEKLVEEFNGIKNEFFRLDEKFDTQPTRANFNTSLLFNTLLPQLSNLGSSIGSGKGSSNGLPKKRLDIDEVCKAKSVQLQELLTEVYGSDSN